MMKIQYGSHPLIGSVFLSLLLGLLASGSLHAQDELERPPDIPPEAEAEPPADDPDALPPKVQDEQIEPTVTIREEEDRRVEEYRMNGRLYMVKITPERGVPYYFIDTDGDGRLERDDPRNQSLEPVQPVFWKIKEWK